MALTHRPVRRLRPRERVATAEFPNFRDHRMMLDTPLLRLLGHLQKRFGFAFAAESGLRRMICADTGHMPGIDSVPCALERLERQGVLYQEWLYAGGCMPDGSPCTHGTRLIYLAQGRAQRRTIAARAGARDRRAGVSYRYSPRAVHTLVQAQAAIGQIQRGPQTPSERDAWLRARRQAQLDALAAFDPTPPPKDKPPG